MSHNLEHRNYIIFNTSHLGIINFNEVLEDSIATVRKSIDGLKVVLKWDGETIPTSVQSLPSHDGIYNNEEVLQIMNTTEWTSYDTL